MPLCRLFVQIFSKAEDHMMIVAVARVVVFENSRLLF